MSYSGISLRGGSFLSPDTRLECFLRGAKFFAKNLRGLKILTKNLRGLKISPLQKKGGAKIRGGGAKFEGGAKILRKKMGGCEIFRINSDGGAKLGGGAKFCTKTVGRYVQNEPKDYLGSAKR